MKTLYDTDFHGWILAQEKLLKSHEYEKIDIDHLMEELKDLSGSEKRAIKSHITIILIHMLKLITQTGRDKKSWNDSISNARTMILFIIEDSPSLKNYPSEIYVSCYPRALRSAAKVMEKEIEELPLRCPWSIDEVLGEEFFKEQE